MKGNSVPILMAEDDPDDWMLVKEAFEESNLLTELFFVEDGEQLMNFLYHKEEYIDPVKAPRPGLILLDLNMPKKDGREVLQEIKSDSNLRQIPVIVLSTSRIEDDIIQSYHLGANSFITKPVTFQGLVDMVKSLGKYWFQIVELPPYG